MPTQINTKFFTNKVTTITIGDERTLPSLENALLGLCKGDNRSVIIHPDAAYGEAGIKNMIPMYATIIYDITILELLPTKPGL